MTSAPYSGRSLRALAFAGLILISGFSALTSRGLAQVAVEEYRVKAELLERFARFVEWPDGGFASGEFVLGVVGDDPFGGVLDEIARERTLHGQPIRIRRTTIEELDESVHLVFVADASPEGLAAVLAKTRDRPVLIVADAPGATQRGALMNFVRDGDRIAFEVNVTAVGRSGLEMSSKLLRLARRYEEDAP